MDNYLKRKKEQTIYLSFDPDNAGTDRLSLLIHSWFRTIFLALLNKKNGMEHREKRSIHLQ